MLKVDNVDVSYGDVQVLFDVSLDIQEGELVAVIGANGAGKTTLLKTISGILTPQKGSINFEDKVISTQPSNKTVGDGIIHVPEGRLTGGRKKMGTRMCLHPSGAVAYMQQVVD